MTQRPQKFGFPEAPVVLELRRLRLLVGLHFAP
jgi:hypothetical protein